MPIECLKGNLSDKEESKFQIDYVDLEWYDTRKKIARWKTRKGEEISVKLIDAPKMGLSQGDILFEEGIKIIAINILPTEVLCIYAHTVTEVAKICYEIGNRHAALFFGENEFEFKTPFEKPIKVLLDKLGIENAVSSSKLDSSKRISVSMAHTEPNFKIKESPDLKIILSGEKIGNK
ncbi:urease accessory protein UreE [Helicobacter sp. 12S02232-10]|uniref:urease accessory protein UreE n=1 Tax=Helicobacter sp. 12S02232-10 TaxID=1476197 RepID=UPI000BA76383|nr:urease accessory protein UreE [Helicobacter sp. 12S02232-10]PAF47445.1 urease accessory protein UreE [Helicobacter sp. 12S02232-10]